MQIHANIMAISYKVNICILDASMCHKRRQTGGPAHPTMHENRGAASVNAHDSVFSNLTDQSWPGPTRSCPVNCGAAVAVSSLTSSRDFIKTRRIVETQRNLLSP